MNGNAPNSPPQNYRGGALLALNSSSPSYLELEDVTFNACHASSPDGTGAGGAVATIVSVMSTWRQLTSQSQRATITMRRVEFVDCYAGVAGGFYADGATANITDTHFTNCSSVSLNGGAGTVLGLILFLLNTHSNQSRACSGGGGWEPAVVRPMLVRGLQER